MQPLDSQFFEEFKKLEKLCSEMFGEKNGVTCYINEMEANQWKGSTIILSWDDDYKALKHVRWIRNKLAHDSVEQQLCEQKDIAFLKEFIKKIYSAKDPLALLNKEKTNKVTKKQSHNSTSDHPGCFGALGILVCTAILLGLLVFIVYQLFQ